MLYHFGDLTDDIPSDVRELLKQNDKRAHRKLHDIIPGKFKVPTDLNTDKNISTNNKSFLQIFKLFLKMNDVLSFSFVRHPFER